MDGLSGAPAVGTCGEPELAVPHAQLLRSASALYVHSLRLAMRWAVAAATSRAPRGAWREAIRRIVLPLDLWRYAELPLVARDMPHGRVLDVASPKLLASHAIHRGRTWEVVDLDAQEVAEWRSLDPRLPIAVADATDLPHPDASFDACVCISVIEHIPGAGNGLALAEMYRVLRPGGRLFLTTNVTATSYAVHIEEAAFGDATSTEGERFFFERRMPLEDVLALVHGSGRWQVERQVVVRQRRYDIQRWYSRSTPWSHLLGPLLWLVAVRGFSYSNRQQALGTGSDEHEVLYLCLRRLDPGDDDAARTGN